MKHTDKRENDCFSKRATINVVKGVFWYAYNFIKHGLPTKRKALSQVTKQKAGGGIQVNVNSAHTILDDIKAEENQPVQPWWRVTHIV